MFNKQIGNDMCLRVMLKKQIGNNVFTVYYSINRSVTMCVYRVMFNTRIGNDICLPVMFNKQIGNDAFTCSVQ